MKPLLCIALLLGPIGIRAQEPAPTSPQPVCSHSALPQSEPAQLPGEAPAATCLQESADPAARRRIDALVAEVDSLKKKRSRWDRIVAALPRISGYVQVGYGWSETSSSFFIKRVRLNLTGDIVRKLDYRVQIEFASPKIVDAYLRYRPFNELNFQLGEYKIPFSIENTDYPPLRFEFIEYPLSLRKLMGFSDLCGLSATGRDMGAMVYGGFWKRDGYSVLNYNFAVMNGEGLNTRDRNKSKDIVARLSVKPVAGLQITGSYYRGEYGAGYLRRVRYGAGICYDRGRAVLRGEYICGTTGMPADETHPAYDQDSDGWYAVAGWRATRKLLTVVRYDTFRENTATRSRQTDYTAGVVWEPVKHLRCQLDYTYESFAAPGAKDRNSVQVMLTGVF